MSTSKDDHSNTTETGATWLRLLPHEASLVKEDELIEPPEEVQKGEKILGEMSLIAKKLFTLSQTLRKDEEQTLLDLRYSRDKSKIPELHAKYQELHLKADAILEIMWITIHEELVSYDKNISIRAGFKVIEMPPQRGPGFQIFNLGDLMH